MIYQKRLTSKFSLSSFFWHQLQDVWPCMNKHWPFQMVCQKWFAEWEFKGLRGLPRFRTKGRVERHSLAISFGCFFCLEFWQISESHWSYTQHHYSAQIVFDMLSLNCSLSFMHWDIIMCLVSNERRENALDNEAYSLSQSCMAMKISHW